MNIDSSVRDSYDEFLDRDLLVFEGLSEEARNEAIESLADLKGELAKHLREGHYSGVVFGWKSLSQLAARFQIKRFLFRGHTEPQPSLLPGKPHGAKYGFERQVLTSAIRIHGDLELAIRGNTDDFDLIEEAHKTGANLFWTYAAHPAPD